MEEAHSSLMRLKEDGEMLRFNKNVDEKVRNIHGKSDKDKDKLRDKMEWYTVATELSNKVGLKSSTFYDLNKYWKANVILVK
jgi:hypothetical protein